MGLAIRRYRRREMTTWAIAGAAVAGCVLAGPASAQSTATQAAQPVQVVPVVQAGQTITSDTAVPQSGKSIAVTVPRYSDPLADTAAVALGALRTRGPGVASAAAVAGNGAVSSVVVVAASPQTQVLSGIAPPLIVQGVTAPSVDGQTWTSVVLDTNLVNDYLVGTAIEVPQAPATQAVINSLPTDGPNRYQASLHQVALLVAGRIKGSNAADFERVWARTNDRRMTVILTALAQVGTMYRWTGNQPGGFDCSGLTSYSWARAGVKIPRTSIEQINALTPRVQADIEVGDLLYRPGHIGLYLGVSDFMVHSPQTGKAVEVRHWGTITRFGTPI